MNNSSTLIAAIFAICCTSGCSEQTSDGLKDSEGSESLFAEGSVAMGFGMGNESCATAMQYEDSAMDWAMGYWTGVNTARGYEVGQHTDGNGIWAEIRKACEDSPSITLLNASTDAFDKVKNLESGQSPKIENN